MRMKKHLWAGFVVALALFCSCDNAPVLLENESYKKRVEQDFEKKKQIFPDGFLEAACDTAGLGPMEREAMLFLYAYMPIADITDYPASFFLENYRLSFQAMTEMPWGLTVPMSLYRHFVLPVRVNNENLDDSRRVFYAELKDRVKGLSMKDAILEVNHWCHEKVVYRPSDARTSSPLASVKTAYGRCGEESTFLVAALRSVGIPARQVYTPRWAHTDDNHAWVEAWADGQWYFLGACEPEPVLNLGWFNAPASRGMLMHTKVFGHYEGPEEVMQRTPTYTEINVIDNYAPTSHATVHVVDAQGSPVKDAKVEFKVYNYAEFYTVATKYTDSLGVAALTAGKGDVLVWASSKGAYGYGKLSFASDSLVSMTLKLDKTAGAVETVELDIVPPAEGANLPEVTAEQRAENNRRMAYEDSIRHAYEATMMTPEQAKAWVEEHCGATLKSSEARSKVAEYLVGSRGNHATLKDFLRSAGESQQRAIDLLGQLSAKDLRDVTAEVLNDHLDHSVMKNDDALSQRALLNPRVSHEMLTPYKKALQEVLTGEVGSTPEALVAWCARNIRIESEYAQRIFISPLGVWRSRVADERSRDVFFVSAARSLGIPAWIDAVTGKVQYADEKGMTHDVKFGSEAITSQAETGMLQATYTPSAVLDDPKYYSHFTLSKYSDGSFRLLNYDEEGTTWNSLLKQGVKLDVGYYMLVTGMRLASGAVLTKVNFFNIEAGKTTNIDLVVRQSTDQVQVIGSFNSESTYQSTTSCTAASFLQTCGRGYYVVGILGVGQEPTNHALRDIASLKADFEQWGRGLVLLFGSQEDYAKFRPSEFPALPTTVTYGIDTDGVVRRQIVENMKLSGQGALPIFIVADTFNRVVFVSQGYTIGLGEQLMQTIKGL